LRAFTPIVSQGVALYQILRQPRQQTGRKNPQMFSRDISAIASPFPGLFREHARAGNLKYTHNCTDEDAFFAQPALKTSQFGNLLSTSAPRNKSKSDVKSMST
jgi:hypothetical protein